MAITQRDVMLLFTMGLAVVSMSLVFPAMGLSDESVSSSDIPELSIDDSTFDLTGEVPEAPGGPGGGNLSWIDGREDQLNQAWPRGSTSGGIEIGLLTPNVDQPAHIFIAEWDSGQLVGEDQHNFSSEGETWIMINESMGIEAQFEVTLYNESAGNYAVEYDVLSLQQSGGGGWFSNLPVIGGAIDGVQSVATVLGWFVEMFAWASLYIIELIANAIAVAGTVGFYFVELITWLATTYSSIVAGANSWVSIFVALPGILLSVVLGKFVIIGIQLLPTT